MIKLITRLEKDATGERPVAGTLHLTFDDRKRGRLSTQTDDGEPVGIFLERGKVLVDQDCLMSEDGKVYQILAAAEPVVEALSNDWVAFSKVCYHLGNRHVPLQVGERWLRFQPDHVLEEMVKLYGLTTRHESLPFQPESGAYGGHSHNHGPGQDRQPLKILSIER